MVGLGTCPAQEQNTRTHAQKHWVQSPAPKGHNNNRGHKAGHSDMAQAARDGDFGAREATER